MCPGNSISQHLQIVLDSVLGNQIDGLDEVLGLNKNGGTEFSVRIYVVEVADLVAIPTKIFIHIRSRLIICFPKISPSIHLTDPIENFRSLLKISLETSKSHETNLTMSSRKINVFLQFLS